MERLNFVKNGVLRLPPGFRFHPTDEELVLQYLKRKVFSCPCLPLSSLRLKSARLTLGICQVIVSKRGTSSALGKPSTPMGADQTEQPVLGIGRQLG
ncbi:NAC domain-containing protein 83 [Prunus yedoensis var. nudiflora]|uniref:NAC domain-containing protein 83 n=1 Tax=Prunus yedoensis var. nudiflora TaxID=2094558 RepID=A0A314U928_PRUYE|nr:NAC domain-containing protein 83 [Prunus yedoensis var. nudiflora]